MITVSAEKNNRLPVTEPFPLKVIMSEQDMNLIIPALEDVFLSRYVALAAFTICVYDWALLCIDEYELVGRSRFSLGKVLYYFSRVTTPLGLAMALYHLSPYRRELSTHFCVVFMFISPLLELACFFASYCELNLPGPYLISGEMCRASYAARGCSL